MWKRVYVEDMQKYLKRGVNYDYSSGYVTKGALLSIFIVYYFINAKFWIILTVCTVLFHPSQFEGILHKYSVHLCAMLDTPSVHIHVKGFGRGISNT